MINYKSIIVKYNKNWNNKSKISFSHESPRDTNGQN